jgi:hypothetical protein
VADRLGGLRIFDASQPSQPRELGSAGSGRRFALGIEVAGDRAFVASRQDGLRIFDVADPRAPRALTAIDTPGEAWHVVIAGTLAFVADGSAGLRILDLSDAP